MRRFSQERLPAPFLHDLCVSGTIQGVNVRTPWREEISSSCGVMSGLTSNSLPSSLYSAALSLACSADQPRHLAANQCWVAKTFCGSRKQENVMSSPETTKLWSGSDSKEDLLDRVSEAYGAEQEGQSRRCCSLSPKASFCGSRKSGDDCNNAISSLESTKVGCQSSPGRSCLNRVREVILTKRSRFETI